MSDEVDDLLRRTMATLDRQVPDGYFDTLVSRALVRLDVPALGEPPGPRGHEPQDPHAAATAATDQAAAMSGPRGPSNHRSIVAVVGLGLAAAAGAMIFVGTRDKTASAPELAVRRERSEAHATNSAPVGAEPKATASETAASGSAVITSEPAPAEAHVGSAARGDQITEAEKPAGNVAQVARPAVPAVEQGAALGKIAKKPIATKGRGKGAFTDELTKFTDEPTKFKNRPSEDTPGEGKPGGAAPWTGKTVRGALSGHDGELSTREPSKQAVHASSADKPELDQPPLSSDDIQRGMTAVAGTAKACFAGTQGTATVQLTVAPSGRVQKATVTGVFAGTSTGACVEQAVRAATFPPFDGEPQNFAYDYLISH